MSFSKVVKYLVTFSAISAVGLAGFYLIKREQPGKSESKKLPPGIKADKVIVYKEDRRLILMKEGNALKEYDISLGGNPVGHKQMEGDSKTPEGKYILDWRNPNSKFHLSLHISYPNGDDKQRAEEMGVSPGGDIMIHGFPNEMDWNAVYYTSTDWTDGCIAVTNDEIEEIWNVIDNGTEIEIFP